MEIEFKEPWADLRGDPAKVGVQMQLDKEIGVSHPLYKLRPEIIGRSGANDDVAVVLVDKRYAIVHLIWNSQQGSREKYPTVRFYPSLVELQAKIEEDAFGFGY